jgi:hypothetical protein
MRNYIDGFEAGADAWIETLEETRDTSFEVTRACAVAIAVPMAVSALPATAGIGTSLVVGTGAGAITSGTVTAGTEVCFSLSLPHLSLLTTCVHLPRSLDRA